MVGGLPVLRRVGTAAGSNRRIRKTVRPVVWEGAGAQSPVPDPIMTSHWLSGPLLSRSATFLRLCATSGADHCLRTA